MPTDEEKKLLVKFPEDNPSGDVKNGNGVAVGTSAPNNLVDQAADFLPRALLAIKECFKEAVFLFGLLGYVFIAAFGHMERIRNYIGYFLVFVIFVTIYKIWNKIGARDFLYLFVIVSLVIYIVSMKINFPFFR